MNIIKFSVKRPVSLTIIVAVLLILGFFTLSKLSAELYPDMSLPIAIVMTQYPGAGPEEVEEQVSKTLEGALSSLSNLSEISSTSVAGSSTVILRYNWGTNMDSTMMEIREQIGLIETFLPDGVEKPFVLKLDPNLMPIIQLSITSETENLTQLQTLVEDLFESRLARIPGVADVYITGGLEREIKIEVDPVKLENYGISLSQVNQVLQAENFSASSGRIEQGERKYFVRSLQNFESIEDIKDVAILTPQGNTILLKDIAEIIQGNKDSEQLTRVNSQAAVALHVQKQSDANTVTTSNAVRAELEKIKAELNRDVGINIVFDQADFIKQSLNNTQTLIVQGAILAMLIVFLFLANMRSTFIIFTAIPLSIITTFIVMYFANYTLNLITLGGLALGVGRMVDDSIVVYENIFRHRSEGMGRIDAAIKGASEVGSAVVATTLTVIAVFLPIVFVEGIASILFRPMALTVCISLLCSTLVALTIIPLLSSRLLSDKTMQKAAEKKGRTGRLTQGFANGMDRLSNRYQKALRWALGHRKTVVFSVIGLMMGAVALVPFIGAEFMPNMDTGEISISVESDKGSTLKYTEDITEKMEDKLLTLSEVDFVFSSVGSAGGMNMGGGGQSDRATIYVKLNPLKDRARNVEEVAENVRLLMVDIPGVKIGVSVMDGAGMPTGSGGPINIQIRGDDLDVLKGISSEILAIVKAVPGTREVNSSLSDGNPELQIKVDRKRAAAYGLTPRQVSTEIRNALEGSVVSRYRVQGQETDIRVRYKPSGHHDIQYLNSLPILTQQGNVVRLSQVASFDMEQGPTTITRVEQVRQATIDAQLLNRDLNSVMTDIRSDLDKLDLPAGYVINYGGEDKEMMESFQSLLLALLLAFILVYAVMAIQYESFFNPFVIMFAVPTAFIGAALALVMTGKTFNVAAFIGLIMMVGIVVSNAIIFVDYLERMRRAGMERNEAILESGRVRLRPILMTSLSTALAMLPLAIGRGEGSEFQGPLGTVVIGGLLASSLITLLLVPVIYTILDDWVVKAKNRFSKRNQETETKEISEQM